MSDSRYLVIELRPNNPRSKVLTFLGFTHWAITVIIAIWISRNTSRPVMAIWTLECWGYGLGVIRAKKKWRRVAGGRSTAFSEERHKLIKHLSHGQRNPICLTNKCHLGHSGALNGEIRAEMRADSKCLVPSDVSKWKATETKRWCEWINL